MIRVVISEEYGHRIFVHNCFPLELATGQKINDYICSPSFNRHLAIYAEIKKKKPYNRIPISAAGQNILKRHRWSGNLEVIKLIFNVNSLEVSKYFKINLSACIFNVINKNLVQ